MNSPTWKNVEPEDEQIYEEWLETWETDTFDDSIVLSALSYFYFQCPTPANPTLNDRMWPALWYPGINRDSEQYRGIQFAAPLWERSGKPRDYHGGDFSDKEISWSYSEEVGIHATGCYAARIPYRGKTLDERWTITCWLKWDLSAQANILTLRNDTNGTTPVRMEYAPVGGGVRLDIDTYGGGIGCGINGPSCLTDQYWLWHFVSIKCTQGNSETHPYSYTITADGQEGVNCATSARIDDIEYVEFGDGTYDNTNIKDVRIYNRELTEGELDQIANHPSELWTWSNTLALKDYALIIGSGGIVCGGDSTVLGSTTPETSGGVECGGSTDIGGSETLPIGGRVFVKGTSTPTGPMTYTPSGRLIMGGGVLSSNLTFGPSLGGRIIVRGAATIEYFVEVGGAIIMGGSDIPTIAYDPQVTGGVVIGSPSFPSGYTLRTTVTVPAGEVSADLTKFYLGLVLDLDASSVLVTDESGTELYFDLHKYDGEKVWLFVKTDLDASSDNVFFVYHD